MPKKFAKNSKIYILASKPEDWRELLANPIKHWRTGYSAKTLAYCWQQANGFPESIRRVFKNANLSIFKEIELLIALPEYKVPLPGGLRASQNDIFVLAKADNKLVAIAVEGKVSEDFGPLISDWLNTKDKKTNKPERIDFLVKKINIEGKNIQDIRYQLIHRTASSIMEAERFNAKHALMLIHSFSQTYEHFDDFAKFISLYDLKAEKDGISEPIVINGINLYFGWVRGEAKFLTL